jgi:hypothetical protein
MQKFNKLFEPGTKIKVLGQSKWYEVKSIHPNRKVLTVKGLSGSFQRVHVTKFSNLGENKQRSKSNEKK